MGVDQYPNDVEEAYNMMLIYSLVVGNTNPGNKEIKDLYTTVISFYQSPTESQEAEPLNKITPGASGNKTKNILYYACNMLGHYANDCPNSINDAKNVSKNSGENGFSFVQHNLNLTQMKGKKLDLKWVLLDTQSSCNIFNNADLLYDIKTEPGTGLNLHSNRDGFIETNMTGVVRGYKKVWSHPNSLANIMSYQMSIKSSTSKSTQDQTMRIQVSMW